MTRNSKILAIPFAKLIALVWLLLVNLLYYLQFLERLSPFLARFWGKLLGHS